MQTHSNLQKYEAIAKSRQNSYSTDSKTSTHSHSAFATEASKSLLTFHYIILFKMGWMLTHCWAFVQIGGKRIYSSPESRQAHLTWRSENFPIAAWVNGSATGCLGQTGRGELQWWRWVGATVGTADLHFGCHLTLTLAIRVQIWKRFQRLSRKRPKCLQTR